MEITPLNITITTTNDTPCPTCGAYWDNPDKSLDFPNRPKVDNAWKCYNPACPIDYYDPDSGELEFYHPTHNEDWVASWDNARCDEVIYPLTQEQQDAREAMRKPMYDRIAAKVKKDIAQNGMKVFTHNSDGTVTEEFIGGNGS